MVTFFCLQVTLVSNTDLQPMRTTYQDSCGLYTVNGIRAALLSNECDAMKLAQVASAEQHRLHTVYYTARGKVARLAERRAFIRAGLHEKFYDSTLHAKRHASQKKKYGTKVTPLKKAHTNAGEPRVTF